MEGAVGRGPDSGGSASALAVSAVVACAPLQVRHASSMMRSSEAFCAICSGVVWSSIAPSPVRRMMSSAAVVFAKRAGGGGCGIHPLIARLKSA